MAIDTLAASYAAEIFADTSATEDATYTPSGGSASTVQIAKQIDLANQLLGDSEVSNSDVLVFVKSADVPNVAQGDTMVINGVAYYVSDPGINDFGVRQLRLSTASPA